MHTCVLKLVDLSGLYTFIFNYSLAFFSHKRGCAREIKTGKYLLKKYALRILQFYVIFGILSFDRWNGMFPNRPVHVHVFLT